MAPNPIISRYHFGNFVHKGLNLRLHCFDLLFFVQQVAQQIELMEFVHKTALSENDDARTALRSFPYTEAGKFHVTCCRVK